MCPPSPNYRKTKNGTIMTTISVGWSIKFCLILNCSGAVLNAGVRCLSHYDNHRIIILVFMTGTNEVDFA